VIADVADRTTRSRAPSKTMQLNLGMSMSRGYVRRLNKKLRYSWSTNKTRPLTCPTILSPQDIQSKSCALGGRVSAQYCSNGKTYLLAWMSQRWNDTEGSSPPLRFPARIEPWQTSRVLLMIRGHISYQTLRSYLGPTSRCTTLTWPSPTRTSTEVHQRPR